MAEEEDPFGMGSAPPLAEPDGMGFDAPPPAAPADGLDVMGGMDGGSDAMPSFGDVAPPPEMPAMDNGGMGMGMPDMGGGMPDMGGGMGMGAMDASAFSAPPGGEMGPVAKWRIENEEKVSQKAAAAKAAEAAKIAEAETALQQFYAERAEKTQKRAAANRAEEAQYVQDRDAAMIADSWDSVCKLVDLKEKANQEVDTSRMRSLLIQLKN